MNKQTSSRVSTIAAQVLSISHVEAGENVDGNDYNDLLDHAKTLAGSCMSQDETPGNAQPAGDFHSRLKEERADLERRLIALNSYLSHNPGHPNPRHNAMLTEQARLMSELLAVLDERLCDIGISERSAPVEEAEEIEDHDDGA
jgi:uncharacterized protein YjiS (DUF1127 family)